MVHWKKEVFTVPNLLSLLRLVLIPVYIRLYLHARDPIGYYTAGGILTLSCLTDAADGIIARRFHMISNLGKILDPLADKVTQLAVILSLSLKHTALRPVLVLFLVKEIFQLAAGAILLRHRKMLSGALMAGKLCTTVLFTSLILLVLFPQIHSNAVNGIALLDSIFLFVSFLSYGFAYLGNRSCIQDLQ